MATFDEDGNVYIKLNESGEKNDSDMAWDDGAGGRVKQILIWHEHNTCVSGIQTIYERKGDKLISKKHGGTEGNFQMITPRKPLTWVSGHYGKYCIDPELSVNFYMVDVDDSWNYYKVITSLKFGNQEETFGPFGLEKGKPFFYRGGTEIVGFHGFSKDATDSRFGYISAIGLYITTGAVGFVGEPSTRISGGQN